MKLSQILSAGVLVIAPFAAVVSAEAAVVNDSQILDVVKTADEGEIDAAKVAKSKAHDTRVKDFAASMIEEHKANEKEGKKIAKNNNLKAESNDVSKNLKDDTKSKIKDLKQYKGSAFDKAYIDQQVTMHQQLLNDLDQTYIPAAQNAELKSFLQDTRTHVQEHLSKAQELQSDLSKSM
jgi:putative membrane protein